MNEKRSVDRKLVLLSIVMIVVICVEVSCVLLLIGRINPIMLPYTVYLPENLTQGIPEEVEYVELTMKPRGDVTFSVNDVAVATVMLSPKSVTNVLYLVSKYLVSNLEVTDLQERLINFAIEYGPFRTGVRIFLTYLQWTPFGLDLKFPINP